jgi:hypothetical protein
VRALAVLLQLGSRWPLVKQLDLLCRDELRRLSDLIDAMEAAETGGDQGAIRVVVREAPTPVTPGQDPDTRHTAERETAAGEGKVVDECHIS